MFAGCLQIMWAHSHLIRVGGARYSQIIRAENLDVCRSCDLCLQAATISHARKNGVEHGQRDLYAFILFICLQQMKKTNNEALAAIKKINFEIIGLTEDELERYLKTAINGKDLKRDGPIYRYKKKSLAIYLQQLGIDTDYLFANDKTPLCPVEIKKRQSAAAHATASQKSSATLLKIQQAYNEASCLEKPNQITLAKMSNISLKTVKRYWSQVC